MRRAPKDLVVELSSGVLISSLATIHLLRNTPSHYIVHLDPPHSSSSQCARPIRGPLRNNDLGTCRHNGRPSLAQIGQIMTNHHWVKEPSIPVAPSQQALIIDLATDLLVGYFTGEYLHTRARSGLVFFHANKVWKILYIADNEVVVALRFKDQDAILSGSIPQFDRQDVGSSRVKLTSNPKRQLQTPSNRQIIIESFKNYLIIHAPLGNPVNSTLRLAFDTMLTEQDLTRDSCNDASRILIQTPIRLTRGELESVGEDLSRIGPRELESFLQKAIDSKFPIVMAKGTQPLKKSQKKKALEEEFRSSLDTQHAKAICRNIKEGKIKILAHFSTISATPHAEELIEKRAKMNALQLDELIKENIPRFKSAIQRKTAELLCLDCLLPRAKEVISELEDKPTCNRCGSGLLALVGSSDKNIHNLVSKKKSGKYLTQLEIERLAKARRTADLILSYGKRAIIALTIIGIGPQTASTILASMHTKTSAFYYDLLKAKIHYITTRELWDKTPRAKSLANRGNFNN